MGKDKSLPSDKPKESKYAKKLRIRKRITRKLGYPGILTWPEILAIEKDKEKHR